MKIDVYSPTIRRKEMDAVLTALVEDRIGPGEQARLLVQIAREKLDFDYCMALRSPAIALGVALKALNLEEGQGVILSALSPLYYLTVLNDLKLKPLFTDVAEGSANMSAETVERALHSRPEGLDVRAIILHHNLGYVPDAAALCESGIPLIEDCSQSYGSFCLAGKPDSAPDAVVDTVPAGNTALFTILGLEERDMLTSGGGALLYASQRRNASVLRNLGELPPEYGLPDMNAAMGIVQFRGFAKNKERRQEIAAAYTRAAQRTRHKRFVRDFSVAEKDEEAEARPEEESGTYNNYAFPLILETGIKDVKAYARRKDIVVENAFENTPAGTGLAAPESCPEAYSLSLRTVLFPLYPRLRTEEVEKVAKLITTLP